MQHTKKSLKTSPRSSLARIQLERHLPGSRALLALLLLFALFPLRMSFAGVSDEMRVAAAKKKPKRPPPPPSVPIVKLEEPRLSAWPSPTDPTLQPERVELRKRYLEAQKALDAGQDAVAAPILTELYDSYPTLRAYVAKDLARIALRPYPDCDLPQNVVAELEEHVERIEAEISEPLLGWSEYFKGRALLAQGRAEEAEASFSIALAQDEGPGRALLLYYLGCACEAALRPDDAYTQYRLAEAASEGATKERAAQAARRVSGKTDTYGRLVDWEIRYRSLESRMARQASDSFLEELRTERSQCDFSACERDVKRLEGRTLVKLSRLPEAEAILLPLMDEEIGLGQCRYDTIADLQKAYGTNEADKRRALLQRCVDGQPSLEGAKAYFLLAVLYGDIGAYDQAREILELLPTRFPGSEEALDAQWRLAWDLVRRDEPLLAIDALHDRLEIVEEGTEDEAQARYWLARMYELAGRNEQAHAIYDDVWYRFRSNHYGYLAEWRLEGEWPQVRIPEPVATLPTLKPHPGDEPAVTGLKLLFPGIDEKIAAIESPGPRLQFARALEFWLMGQDSNARAELLSASHHPDATSQLLFMASALRHAMGSMFYGIWYAQRALEQVTAEEMIPTAQLSLAFPMPFREAIIRHSLSRGLEPALAAALIQQESTYRPTIRSPVGAAGLMQIMPGTGQDICAWLGIQHYRSKYLVEPDFNLRLGTEYLRAMLERVKDSVVRALASYNAGPAAVDRWDRKSPIRLEDDVFAEEIPYAETRGYVRHVVRNLGGYLETYGTYLPEVKSGGTAGPAEGSQPSPKESPDLETD